MHPGAAGAGLGPGLLRGLRFELGAGQEDDGPGELVDFYGVGALVGDGDTVGLSGTWRKGERFMGVLLIWHGVEY